ncbi:hypothetical protein AAG570_003442 [Ranatra chinensis]|uniref:Uncharacterized protein n=1 Tax=Ranatra chinensis TaxID=642074 RepID=A0ABD0Y3M5_9HEMI
MASKRQNMFFENKKQETTEIGPCNLPPFCILTSAGYSSSSKETIEDCTQILDTTSGSNIKFGGNVTFNEKLKMCTDISQLFPRFQHDLSKVISPAHKKRKEKNKLKESSLNNTAPNDSEAKISVFKKPVKKHSLNLQFDSSLDESIKETNDKRRNIFKKKIVKDESLNIDSCAQESETNTTAESNNSGRTSLISDEGDKSRDKMFRFKKSVNRRVSMKLDSILDSSRDTSDMVETSGIRSTVFKRQSRRVSLKVNSILDSLSEGEMSVEEQGSEMDFTNGRPETVESQNGSNLRDLNLDSSNGSESVDDNKDKEPLHDEICENDNPDHFDVVGSREDKKISENSHTGVDKNESAVIDSNLIGDKKDNVCLPKETREKSGADDSEAAASQEDEKLSAVKNSDLIDGDKGRDFIPNEICGKSSADNGQEDEKLSEVCWPHESSVNNPNLIDDNKDERCLPDEIREKSSPHNSDADDGQEEKNIPDNICREENKNGSPLNNSKCNKVKKSLPNGIFRKSSADNFYVDNNCPGTNKSESAIDGSELVDDKKDKGCVLGEICVKSNSDNLDTDNRKLSENNCRDENKNESASDDPELIYDKEGKECFPDKICEKSNSDESNRKLSENCFPDGNQIESSISNHEQVKECSLDKICERNNSVNSDKGNEKLSENSFSNTNRKFKLPLHSIREAGNSLEDNSRSGKIPEESTNAESYATVSQEHYSESIINQKSLMPSSEESQFKPSQETCNDSGINIRNSKEQSSKNISHCNLKLSEPIGHDVNISSGGKCSKTNILKDEHPDSTLRNRQSIERLDITGQAVSTSIGTCLPGIRRSKLFNLSGEEVEMDLSIPVLHCSEPVPENISSTHSSKNISGIDDDFCPKKDPSEITQSPVDATERNTTYIVDAGSHSKTFTITGNMDISAVVKNVDVTYVVEDKPVQAKERTYVFNRTFNLDVLSDNQESACTNSENNTDSQVSVESNEVVNKMEKVDVVANLSKVLNKDESEVGCISEKSANETSEANHEDNENIKLIFDYFTESTDENSDGSDVMPDRRNNSQITEPSDIRLSFKENCLSENSSGEHSPKRLSMQKDKHSSDVGQQTETNQPGDGPEIGLNNKTIDGTNNKNISVSLSVRKDVILEQSSPNSNKCREISEVEVGQKSMGEAHSTHHENASGCCKLDEVITGPTDGNQGERRTQSLIGTENSFPLVQKEVREEGMCGELVESENSSCKLSRREAKSLILQEQSVRDSCAKEGDKFDNSVRNENVMSPSRGGEIECVGQINLQNSAKDGGIMSTHSIVSTEIQKVSISAGLHSVEEKKNQSACEDSLSGKADLQLYKSSTTDRPNRGSENKTGQSLPTDNAGKSMNSDECGKELCYDPLPCTEKIEVVTSFVTLEKCTTDEAGKTNFKAGEKQTHSDNQLSSKTHDVNKQNVSEDRSEIKGNVPNLGRFEDDNLMVVQERKVDDVCDKIILTECIVHEEKKGQSENLDNRKGNPETPKIVNLKNTDKHSTPGSRQSDNNCKEIINSFNVPDITIDISRISQDSVIPCIRGKGKWQSTPLPKKMANMAYSSDSDSGNLRRSTRIRKLKDYPRLETTPVAGPPSIVIKEKTDDILSSKGVQVSKSTGTSSADDNTEGSSKRNVEGKSPNGLNTTKLKMSATESSKNVSKKSNRSGNVKSLSPHITDQDPSARTENNGNLFSCKSIQVTKTFVESNTENSTSVNKQVTDNNSLRTHQTVFKKPDVNNKDDSIGLRPKRKCSDTFARKLDDITNVAAVHKPKKKKSVTFNQKLQQISLNASDVSYDSHEKRTFNKQASKSVMGPPDSIYLGNSKIAKGNKSVFSSKKMHSQFSSSIELSIIPRDDRGQPRKNANIYQSTPYPRGKDRSVNKPEEGNNVMMNKSTQMSRNFTTENSADLDTSKTQTPVRSYNTRNKSAIVNDVEPAVDTTLKGKRKVSQDRGDVTVSGIKKLCTDIDNEHETSNDIILHDQRVSRRRGMDNDEDSEFSNTMTELVPSTCTIRNSHNDTTNKNSTTGNKKFCDVHSSVFADVESLYSDCDAAPNSLLSTDVPLSPNSTCYSRSTVIPTETEITRNDSVQPISCYEEEFSNGIIENSAIRSVGDEISEIDLTSSNCASFRSNRSGSYQVLDTSLMAKRRRKGGVSGHKKQGRNKLGKDSIFYSPDRKKAAPSKLADLTINGVAYKNPKMFKPVPWVRKRLYDFLEKVLGPSYDIETKMVSERFVAFLTCHVNNALMFEQNCDIPVDILKTELFRLNICKSELEYYTFLYRYTPKEYYKKALPIGAAPVVGYGTFNMKLLEDPRNSDTTAPAIALKATSEWPP